MVKFVAMPHATKNCENMEEFVTLHRVQLESAGIPRHYWQILFGKLQHEVFDAGDTFIIQQVQEVDEEDEEFDEDSDLNGTSQESDEPPVEMSWQVVVNREDGIGVNDPQHVYLVDHAWTYRVSDARAQLEDVPGLLERMAALMEVSLEDKQRHQAVEEVLTQMWRYNQTYKIDNADLGTESGQPIWYIMDEFGSRVQHCHTPSVKMVPFFHVPTEMSYTIMWPLRSLKDGDEVTRDYLDGRVTDPLIRKLRLLPWQPEDMSHLSYDLQEAGEAFFMKYKVHETLPKPSVSVGTLPRDRSVRVYTDVDQVANNLTDIRFELVSSPEEADVIWTRKLMRDFYGLSVDTPNKLVNQFPFEMVLTVKDLLAVVCRRAGTGDKHIDPDTLDSTPDWLPTTFNLNTELAQFVSFYQHRQHRGLDNHWICKPWNLARALDAHITDDLNYVLRLPDTGPKIASKYVEDPVLFARDDVGKVKFDLRFVILVTSVQPLTLYVYHKFIVRLANKVFSLDHLDDYEKHFTVMNYKPGVTIKEMLCEDFVEQFEEQYPEEKWAKILELIKKMVVDVFAAASSQPPPRGIGASPQSRAIYGFDVMLKWTDKADGSRAMTPVLIECNFGPDNTRLTKARPDFWNDVFGALFLDDVNEKYISSL